MAEQPRCIGLFGRVFGHRFSARFSEQEHARDIPPNVSSDNVTASSIRALSTLQDTRYHGDVCSRCGAIVNASLSGQRD